MVKADLYHVLLLIDQLLLKNGLQEFYSKFLKMKRVTK